MAETHITLYGDSSRLFEAVKATIEAEKGLEPSNADVVRELMAESDRPAPEFDPLGGPAR